MNERTTDNLIPFSGGVFGCLLAVLIPMVFIFFYFLGGGAGVQEAISSAWSMIAFGIFTGPFGAVVGAHLAAYRRMGDTERKKVTYSLVPVLGGVVGWILGFWIPAALIYNAAVQETYENMVPGIFNGACVGFIIGPLGAVGGVFLAKYLRKRYVKEESSNLSQDRF